MRRRQGRGHRVVDAGLFVSHIARPGCARLRIQLFACVYYVAKYQGHLVAPLWRRMAHGAPFSRSNPALIRECKSVRADTTYSTEHVITGRITPALSCERNANQ